LFIFKQIVEKPISLADSRLVNITRQPFIGRFTVKFRHLFWLLLCIAALAIMGCEGDTGPAGPAGPPGEDGADGADGANGTSVAVCMDCHNDLYADYDFLNIILQYSQSGHKAGNYVGYAGGRASCGRCHSKQGFIEYAVTGDVAGDIPDPASIDCATCHIVHPFAFGIRLTDPVALIIDDTYMLDFGDNSNLCANCHQARTAEPNTAAPADTFAITSTHYGPHHGPQAMVLEGVGFAEIPGSADYPNGSLHLMQGATCVVCHMYDYALNADDEGMGGHTWWPNLEACNGCHFTSDDDFNHGNVQAEVMEKLEVLRDRLVELGVMDASYEVIPGTYPMIQAQAYYNWIGLEEDRSMGVHNPPYVNALLDNTIEALAPATP